MMNKHFFLNATQEGKKLDLTYEQEHQCKLVYKKSEDGDGYIFSDYWNPEADYSDEHVIVPLRSVFYSVFSYEENDVFANVIGSTYDPNPYPSWIQLFRDYNITCTSCVMDNIFYDSRDITARTYFKDYTCGGQIVGGHVVNGTTVQSPAANSYVLLMPICHNHNSCCTDYTGQNGSGFFMMPKTKGIGIRLTSYLHIS